MSYYTCLVCHERCYATASYVHATECAACGAPLAQANDPAPRYWLADEDDGQRALEVGLVANGAHGPRHSA